MRSMSTRAAAGASLLRSAVQNGELAGSMDGLGMFVELPLAVCAAASKAIALFGARRASEVVQLLARNVAADLDACIFRIKMAGRKMVRWAQVNWSSW